MELGAKRRVLALFWAVLFVFLCGCEGLIATPDDLLQPPALTGELKTISDALAKSIKEEYTLVYPSAGEMRSAIALEDIDGDGIKEAVAFYGTKSGEGAEMHINLVKKTSGKWRSVADNVITAGGVEKVIFCDLSGNGKKEILVGWEVFGGREKKLGIYSAADDRLYERFMREYTTFTCCDIYGNDRQQLVLQYVDPGDTGNVVSVYTLSANSVNQTAGCILDGKVKSASEPVVSKLTDGTPALFIDEEKGAGMITEVLYLKDGTLMNPLFDAEKGENTATQRGSGLYCSDIDNDGAAEIPVSVEAPGAETAGEKGYFTNWCAFDGETLNVKMTCVMNLADGYYLILPSKLADSTAVLRNTETRTRSFYEYDRETAKTGAKMFSVTAVDTVKSEKFLEENRNAQVIYEDEQTVIAAEIFSGGSKLTLYDIKEMFRTIE